MRASEVFVMRPSRVCTSSLLLLVALHSAVTVAAETLIYTLAPQPNRGRLDVELVWQTEGRIGSELGTSERWGSVQDVPRLLGNVAITGTSSVRRDGVVWKLRHRRGATVRCRYAVRPQARVFDWDAIHQPVTTRNFFHGIGTTFLLAPRPGGGGAPEEYEVLIRWRVPEGWKAACSWAYGRTVGDRLNVDDLRHSVYLAGRLKTEVRQVEGANELIVTMLDAFEFDVEAFADLAANIIRAECAAMHETQFPRYLVTVAPVGQPLAAGTQRSSGTGLYHSFALFLPPKAKLTDGVEHLFAHELFHHWNGRLLQRVEPEEHVYWFSEGFTDYYALRILFESERWSAETYAKWLNRHIRNYHDNPARNASNAEIQAGYWSKRETVGEVPYQRGLLLGVRWHHIARQRGIPDGLDRLVLALLDRARTRGWRLSNAGIRQAGCELLGNWFGPEFDRYVMQAQTVDVPPDALRPELTGTIEKVFAYELGFEQDTSLDEGRITGLKGDSAAARAGLQEGDELAGWAIHTNEPDRKVHLMVRRDGELHSIEYYPRGVSRDLLQFRPVEATTE